MTRLTVRIDFSAGRQLGHGKVRLLELVAQHGSISAAARVMGMSYRRAWLLVDDVNRMFQQAVIATTLGGKGGGKAELTDFGRELVDLYREIETTSLARFGERIARIEAQAREADAGHSPPDDL